MTDRQKRALIKAARYGAIAAFLAAAPVGIEYLAGVPGSAAMILAAVLAALIGFIKEHRRELEGD